jgi:hypothetical protein
MIPMSSLQVGDMIKTSDDRFSRVVSFLHDDPDADMDYIQIYTDGSDQPLEVSHDHFLYKNVTPNKQVILAQDVQVGDMLDGAGSGKVTHIQTVKCQGLYAPVTENGTILVSGVSASCYVHFMDGVASTIQIYASHAALSPLRLACAYDFGICQNERHEDGYTNNLSWLIRFGLQLSQWSGWMQQLVVLVSSPVLMGLASLEVMIHHSTMTAAVSMGLLMFLARHWLLSSHGKRMPKTA